MKNALQQKYGFELLLTLYGIGSTEFVQLKKRKDRHLETNTGEYLC